MVDQLPAPLVEAEVDLRGMPYMPLFGDRLFGSATWIAASAEAKVAALRLWWRSFAHEVPAGSLPDDDTLLSDYAGYGVAVKAWRKVKAQAMRGWILCSDGRLYHRTVAEVAMEAWDTRKRNREKQARWRNKDRIVTPRVTVTEGVTDAVTKPFRNAGREEKGREGTTSEDKSSEDTSSPEVDEAYGLFVAAASEFGWPKPRKLEPDRRKKLKARLAEHGLDGWGQMLANARASDFLRTKFALKLDWVLEPRNFRKVLEGNYGAACDGPPSPPSSDEILWEARFRGYHPGGMWQEATWGPRPESGRCIAPQPVLERWRGRVAQ